MSLTRRVGGLLAKRRGDQFEGFFESRVKAQGMACIRIPDGCKQIGANKLIRVRTPFDYILGYSGKVGFFDLKSIDGKTLPKSRIEAHQLVALQKMKFYAVTGYICFFRETKSFVFFNSDILADVEARDSLTESDGVFLGNLLNHDFRGIFKNAG